jgi:hypothetical protein
MVDMGLDSLKWLITIQTEDNHFVPIGSNGWYEQDGLRARFDQQPIEANAMVEACVEASNVTRDKIMVRQCSHVFQLVSRTQRPQPAALRSQDRRTCRSRGLLFRRLLEQTVVTGPIAEVDVTHGYDWSRHQQVEIKEELTDCPP